MSGEARCAVNKGGRLAILLWSVLLVVLVVAGVLLARLCELEKPTVVLASDVTVLGSKTPLAIAFQDEKSGIREIEASVTQDTKKVMVLDRKNSRKGFLTPGGPRRMEESTVIDVKSLGLIDGPAQLVVTARDFSLWGWLKGNTTTLIHPVEIDAKPPRLSLLDSPLFLKAATAGTVVYQASEPLSAHGVVLNGYFHPGHPLPARGKDVYVALIAVPHDAEAITEANLTGRDLAGNESTVGMKLGYRKARLKTDTITISDDFLTQKVPEFAQHHPEMAGTPIEQFLYVNREVRRKNAAHIVQLCGQSQPERLWDGRFNRMHRSSQSAGFAELRTYLYNGQQMAQEFHLGVDLASLRFSDVEAANRGRVVFADYLGIYGNMVLIDHGLGVFSLYSHLSQLTVKAGDQVEKGARIGKTGMTGMAGGDHLHFSMLVNGIFVDPLEWWDLNWLTVNITDYLKGAPPAPSSAPSS